MPAPVLMPDPAAPAVVLNGLTKTYQEGGQQRVVLDGIEAEINRGEFIVLLGRSGSGKSTLLNLISGIDVPTTGRVVRGGIDVTQASEQSRTLFRRQHIGFVFQSFNLLPTLTVAENLLLPLELSGILTEDETERALNILEEVGLCDPAARFPDRLSGGEQQRVAIARALAHDPRLILADEPTGNLDYQTAEQVLGLIDRLVRQAGKTTLMVTHDRSLIDLADRVLTLRGGKLVAADAAVVHT